VIGKVLSIIITQNRSLGADDLTHSLADQKVRSSVTAPAMFASFSGVGGSVSKIAVTSL